MKHSNKQILRLAGFICFLVCMVFGVMFLFVLDPPDDAVASYVSVSFLILAFALSKLAGKRVIDEREIRVAAKANKLGLAAALAIAVVIAMQAKENPDVMSLRGALGIVFVIPLALSIISHHILLKIPNAENERRESR